MRSRFFLTNAGLRAVAAVAALYAYFLLFAEFALLELLRQPGWSEAQLRLYLVPLVLGGMAGSFWAGRRYQRETAGRGVAAALALAALAAALAGRGPSPALAIVTTLLTGLSLGGATVLLAVHLAVAVPRPFLGVTIGLGTGLAYALCNLPPVFAAPPAVQAAVAATVALLGAIAAWGLPAAAPASHAPNAALAGWSTVGFFLILVWLDSAVFYRLQHEPIWQTLTWSGHSVLWMHAGVHLLAAVVAGYALDLRRQRLVLMLALAALLLAGYILATDFHAGAGVLRLVYPAGVSAYSTALVYVAARSGSPAAAARLFALAGWGGSVLGIGMVQDLQHVPVALVAAAAVVAGALLLRMHRPALLATVVLTGLAIALPAPAHATDDASRIVRGREVYIAEGCIHCHSQFVRPGTADTERWGPPRSLRYLAQESPPLLGNRRQGPDLSNVGLRRTVEWNRLHLIAPRRITPGSRMPAYAHLFRPEGPASDGEALLAYLSSLGRAEPAAEMAE